MFYVSIGILGATVMPHNLYLHSSIAQTRHFDLTSQGKSGSEHAVKLRCDSAGNVYQRKVEDG
jgi:Mn2+/Fe2+ NRAMP family transporter